MKPKGHESRKLPRIYTPSMRAPRLFPATLAAWAAAGPAIAPAPAAIAATTTSPSQGPPRAVTTPAAPELPPRRAGVFAGTLTRLDLGRRSIVILVPAATPKDGPATPATEVELRVTPGSRLISRGREVAFEDLRTDSKVSATWRDDAQGRRELVVLRIR